MTTNSTAGGGRYVDGWDWAVCPASSGWPPSQPQKGIWCGLVRWVLVPGKRRSEPRFGVQMSGLPLKGPDTQSCTYVHDCVFGPSRMPSHRVWGLLGLRAPWRDPSTRTLRAHHAYSAQTWAAPLWVVCWCSSVGGWVCVDSVVSAPMGKRAGHRIIGAKVAYVYPRTWEAYACMSPQNREASPRDDLGEGWLPPSWARPRVRVPARPRDRAQETAYAAGKILHLCNIPPIFFFLGTALSPGTVRNFIHPSGRWFPLSSPPVPGSRRRRALRGPPRPVSPAGSLWVCGCGCGCVACSIIEGNPFVAWRPPALCPQQPEGLHVAS